MTEEILCFPILYGKSSSGKSKVWHARILKNSQGHGIAEIKHGQQGGKLQITERIFQVGKNIGKKNETTPLDQCIFEIKRKWVDKKEKDGYSETEIGDDDTKTIYPMLAQIYTPLQSKKKTIIFPCFVQPKLDGLRCLMYKQSDGTIVAQSRTGGIFESMSIILKEVLPIIEKNPNIVLDGELYTTEIPFENLAGLIKKKYITQEDAKYLNLVEYHIYDLINLENPEMTFFERNSLLKNFFQGKEKIGHLCLVSTCTVSTHDEFYSKFQDFIADGFEGAMLRNVCGVYKQEYRSNDLQKYKEFMEEEFEIIGFKEGEGRDAGTVIWMCKINNGQNTFMVRPRGTIEYRKKLFNTGKNYIGKMLTVIFQEYSGIGVPRFPVGKCIREGF